MLTLAFAVLLLLGVLISERASRTVLSTAVLFLLGGFVLGQGVLGVVPIAPGDPVVGVLASWPRLLCPVYRRHESGVIGPSQGVAFARPGAAARAAADTFFHRPAGPLRCGASVASVLLYSVRCWHRPIRCSRPPLWGARKFLVGYATS